MYSKHKILLIEDTEQLKKSLYHLLSLENDVLCTSEAMEGLEICKKFMPDIILLDIMLKDSIDGLSLLRIIKGIDSINHIPIIIISGLATEANIIESLRLGANDYLIKPFSFEALSLKIKNILNIFDRNNQKILSGKNYPLLTPSYESDLMSKIDLLIEESIFEHKSLSVTLIATKLSVSQSTLERLVKKRKNLTPNQYILSVKLQKAKFLLSSNPSLSIKEVSFALGFSSVSYFCKTFKKHFTKTAKEIRSHTLQTN
ncbi:MAG: response regulator transcription factor [Chitinophagaceae bacterium]